MNNARQTASSFLSTLLIAAGLVIATLNAGASDIKVIVNVSVKADSISANDLRAVFLVTRRTLKDGSPIVPVLNKSGATHEAFVEAYLHRDVDELRTYYQGLVFTGKGSMPRELSSDTEVTAFVASTKGAIGYVDPNFKAEGVKILLVLASGRNAERTLVTRVEPEYPETLKQLHIGGTVRLAVTISPKGTVEGIELLGGNPILGEAAAKAAKQWVYTQHRRGPRLRSAFPLRRARKPTG